MLSASPTLLPWLSSSCLTMGSSSLLPDKGCASLRTCGHHYWVRERAPSQAVQPRGAAPKGRQPGPSVPDTQAVSAGPALLSTRALVPQMWGRPRTAQDEGCRVARPGHSLTQAAGAWGARAGLHWGGATSASQATVSPCSPPTMTLHMLSHDAWSSGWGSRWESRGWRGG